MKVRFFPPPDAYENARDLCERYYMNSPEVKLEEFNGKAEIYFTICLIMRG